MTKQDILLTLKVAVAAIGSWWVSLGVVVHLLLAMISLDILTGMALAFADGKLNSDVSRKGIMRKAMMLLVVSAAHLASSHVPHEALGVEIPLGSAVAIFYILHELLSIVENAARIGLPIPSVLKKAIEKLKEENN